VLLEACVAIQTAIIRFRHTAAEYPVRDLRPHHGACRSPRLERARGARLAGL